MATLDRSGAGANAKPENYSFAGIDYEGHADIRMDAGSPADFNYEPRYPFAAAELIRLYMRGRHLTFAEFHGKRHSEPPPEFPEDRQFSDIPTMPLKFKGSISERQPSGLQARIGTRFPWTH